MLNDMHYLKKIKFIKINRVVRALVIVIVKISLIACGGGGSSSNVAPFNNTFENTITGPREYTESYTLKGNSLWNSDNIVNDNTITDLGDINFYGHGAGIEVKNNSIYNNTSTITASSSNATYTYNIYGDGKLIRVKEGFVGEFAVGLLADDNSTIKNGNFNNRGNNSTITLKGEGAAMHARNSSTAENYGNIELFTEKYTFKNSVLAYGYNSATGKFDDTSWYTTSGNIWSTPIGMYALNNSNAKNYGNITITNGGVGMRALNNSTIINEGTINVGSEKNITPLFLGMHLANKSTGLNEGDIIITGGGLSASGVFVESGSQFTNNGLININVGNQGSNSNNGILVVGNQGNSIDYGFETIGDNTSPTGATNNGEIIVNSAVGSGMYAIYSGASINNNNSIKVSGADSIGMEARFGATAKNNKNGKINVSLGKTGMLAFEAEARALNYGTILVNGAWSFGMEAQDGGCIFNEKNGIIIAESTSGGMLAFEEGSFAFNKGTINVNFFTYGMVAIEGGIAVNEVSGIINVGSRGWGAMYATDSGSKIINKGTINIDKDNVYSKLENGILSTAMRIRNGSTFENSGIINSSGKIDIFSDSNSQYIIDSDEDGHFGTIHALELSLHGNIGVTSAMIEESYDDEYILDNVFVANSINTSNLENVTSTTLLYDASLNKDSDGNLDATLEKNDNKVSDFVDNNIEDFATQLDSFFTSEKYKTLNSDAQDVIDTIFRNSESEKSLNNAVISIVPSIYSNLSRQILETNEIFKNNNFDMIQNLNENSYTFSFLGEHNEVSDRNSIEGYDSNLTGFIGALKLNKNTFISLGYGYNSINYSSNGDGNIETIYLSLDKEFKSNDFLYSFNLNGNYNFHENDRTMNLHNRVANSKFDSYSFGLSNSISRTFGDELFFTPYGNLSLTYLDYNSFTETGANSVNAKIDSENYLSILPTVGVKFENKFNNFTAFFSSEHSYELGTFDKNQSFKYDSLNASGSLFEDNLNSSSLNFEFGLTYKITNLSLTASIGKNFENREKNYFSFNFIYNF